MKKLEGKEREKERVMWGRESEAGERGRKRKEEREREREQ